MSVTPPDTAAGTDRDGNAAARERRRAAALRANLQRRKEQARARAADAGDSTSRPAEED